MDESKSKDSACHRFETNALCYRLVDCYLATTEIPSNFRCMDLKNLLYQTLRELCLSEIETLGWFILLDEIGLKIDSISQKLVLLFTALKAKVLLGYTVHQEILRYKSIYPSLMKDFKAWSTENFAGEILTTRNLCKKYRKLNLPYESDVINYNFYVDYVLMISPMYSSYLVFENQVRKKSKPVRQVHEREINFIDENEFDRIDNF
ncbi:hypothetical protein SteCoe_26607 [Stentor coeruleus]|uniref:Uncharacterized protein n=1 Tax=Stentor coeruleus TaxID=5963 RepID=A0A1R2BCT1_9CILI|nr:hypothetical protein SteCoe_26607 [Stentor coeruleus]